VKTFEITSRRIKSKHLGRKLHHSRLIGLPARVTTNRYAPGSGTLCLSRGRLYVIGEFGGVSVSRLLNGVAVPPSPLLLVAIYSRNVSMRSIMLRARTCTSLRREIHTPLRNYTHRIYKIYTATSMEYLPLRISRSATSPLPKTGRRLVSLKFDISLI